MGVDYDAMNKDIADLGRWPTPPPGMDPNAILEDIYGVLEPIIEKHAPLKVFPVRRDTPSLHLQPETRRVMRLRDEARKKGRKAEYKSLRNRAVRMV